MKFKPEFLTRSGRYRYNLGIESESPEETGFINGQAFGWASLMRYGLCRMSFNGCECIAVYNALVRIGKRIRLCEIIRKAERYKMLFGFFGCSPHGTGKILERFGIIPERTDNPCETGFYIISYWTGIRFFSSIHTVFAETEKSCVKIYNLYNKSNKTHIFGSGEEFANHKKLILAYKINNNI